MLVQPKGHFSRGQGEHALLFAQFIQTGGDPRKVISERFLPCYERKDFLPSFPFLSSLPSSLLSFFPSFFFFRAALKAYRCCQVRGPIRATASGLHHSHSSIRSEMHLQPTLQPGLTQWILNPLSKARDWTHNFMIPSWICFCCARTGTPLPPFLSAIAAACRSSQATDQTCATAATRAIPETKLDP